MYSSIAWKAASVPTLSVRRTWTLKIKIQHLQKIFCGRIILDQLNSYPTIGFLKFMLSFASSSMACVSGWYLSKYFINWPIHQTVGSPWSRIILSERSLGMANGKCGGRGDSMSTIGSSTTCVSLFPVKKKLMELTIAIQWTRLPGQLLLSSPDGFVQVSLTGRKTRSQPPRWYLHFFEFRIMVLFVE